MKRTSNKNYYWAEMGARLRYVAADGHELKMINTRDGRVRSNEIIYGKRYVLNPDENYVIDMVTKPEVGMYIIRKATELEVMANVKIDAQRDKWKFKNKPNEYKRHVAGLRNWYNDEPICVLLSEKKAPPAQDKKMAVYLGRDRPTHTGKRCEVKEDLTGLDGPALMVKFEGESEWYTDIAEAEISYIEEAGNEKV